jgi:AraC family transcriptional regulator
MNQEPELITLPQTHLVGMSARMSRSEDQTPNLWRSFMPRRNEVDQRTNQNYISMQIYPDGPSQVADPQATFIKWAAVAVTTDGQVPQGMQRYELSGGLYAVFHHHGPATDLSTIMFIFQTWLPASEYRLDDREHFEILPENYKPLDANAFEDIYIPIAPKK